MIWILSLLLCGSEPINVPVPPPPPRVELICFGATWCGPCQKAEPLLGRLASKGLPVYYNDIDKHPKMAELYRIQTVPCWLLRVDWEPREKYVGSLTEKQIRSWWGHCTAVLEGRDTWQKVTRPIVRLRVYQSRSTCSGWSYGR